MIKKLFAYSLASVIFAGLFGSLAGCNTVEGVGKDLQSGGQAIKNEANEQRR
jgi:predicted small secreted protein